MAFLNRRFDDLALLGDMRLAFVDLSISLGQVLAFTLHHRLRPLPQSSSSSLFTAGAFAFFILSQSDERPER
jgi:hypothetical protein